MHVLNVGVMVMAVAIVAEASSQDAVPRGDVKGTAVQHTEASSRAVLEQAALVLPARVTGAAVFSGLYRDAPPVALARVPVVVFLHGSSGLGLKAIGEWQRWLASFGVASLAPDSFALPDRVTYTSPVAKEVYENIHALRASEIEVAVRALKSAPWADASRMVLAGTSEGAVAAARYRGDAFVARMLFSWSCENNYFVKEHDSALSARQPVLNVMSLTDIYFSPANAWLGNGAAKGHCGEALKGNTSARIVLIPGAPHTLLNLPAAQQAAEAFLKEVVKP
jgi:dienelactone hydrolase